MKPLNVLVLTPALDGSFPHADEQCLTLIRQAVPSFKVTDGSTLLEEEMKGNTEASRELDKLLQNTDILFGFVPPQNIIRRAPRLRWLQVTSAGVDRLAATDVWHSDIIITGVSGIHAVPISEYILGTMLALVKNSPLAWRQQQRHEWSRYPATCLHGKTAGIIGLGHIGRETARLCKTFGMRTIATRRTAIKRGKARYVDLLLPLNELPQLLGESDFIIISVPLTPATRHLIGEKELKMMKPSAYLINIARGAIVDGEALVHALKNKTIAGAGLDVTEPEPLPPESPLWDMPGVIITPHIAGGMDDYMLSATRLFCENLKRYYQGRRLLNVVNRQRGY